MTAAAGLYRAVGRESNRCRGPERTQNGAVTAGVGRRRNISRILDRFFGQELARRTTQKFGDLVDVIQIVLRAVFGTFHLPDVAVRDAYAVSQHCLRHFLGHALFAHGFYYIVVEGCFHGGLFSRVKLKNVPRRNPRHV